MTLAEIARLAGVSRTTASYVLNGQARAHRISEKTVEKVLATARAHDFRIDAQAAALRRGASRTLGLIIPDLENTSYARLAKLLERGARERGYQILIAGSDDDPASERELALTLKARRCDALIVASCLAESDPFYTDLMDRGLPVIAIDRQLDPQRFVSIVSDNRDGARLLTASVIGPQTRHIAWFDAVPELSITVERRHGFRAAVTKPVDQAFELSGARYDRECGARLMRRLIHEQGLPDALVTSSYTLLQGALDELSVTDGGLDGRMRIATFGDDVLLDFLPISINSLPQRHETVAGIALERAIGAIGGAYEPGCTLVKRQLKRRQSPRAGAPIPSLIE